VEQSLDTQRSLQTLHRLGIEVLATAKGTTPTTQGSIVRFAVVGVNFSLTAQCRPRMLVLDPLPARAALRPLDFHRHLQTFTPCFAYVIDRWELAALEPNAGQLPQLLAVAPLSISEPANALARFRPVPHLTDDSLEQRRVSLAAGATDPVAAVSLQKQSRSAWTLVRRSILLHFRVQLVAFHRHSLLCVRSCFPGCLTGR